MGWGWTDQLGKLSREHEQWPPLAEDYLSHKHDWVQDEDEITAPIGRSLYTPGRKRSHSEHST